MSLLPSASSHDRVRECAASAALPRVYETSDYAERGTGAHDFVRDASARGREAALDVVPVDAPHRKLCENMPLESMPQGGRHEVAFAYDYVTDTARVLGADIGRNYAAFNISATEYVGTADLEGVVGDLVVVVDWKSGYRYLGNPHRSGQLRFLALAACRARGLTQARVSYWYLREDGSFREDVAEFTEMDLLDIRDELRELAARVEGARRIVDAGRVPSVASGPWCVYCPAVASCPAKAALARAMVTEPAELEQRLAALTPEQATDAWLRVKDFKAVAKRIEEGLRAYARLYGIILPGGKVVREMPWPETSLDPKVVHAVVLEFAGSEAADAAAPREATLASLERALRPVAVAAGAKLAPLNRQVLKQIESRDGLRKTYERQVREAKA